MSFLFFRFRMLRERPSRRSSRRMGSRLWGMRRLENPRLDLRGHRRALGYVESLEPRLLLSATPYGASSQDTGEFMLGTVLVTPVFLESTGEIDPSTEDWTPALIEQTKGLVAEGVFWWEETLANYNSVHSLNFVFDFTYANNPVPTRYEPIARVSNDYQLWVNEFLDHVGFQSPESLHHDIREFNHTQREAHNADWAFTIFVVNSDNDLDGQFAPGGSFSRAFAFAGGQFFVSPSTRPASTFAHETGHMFWARDEYLGGGSYLNFRGYYDTQNWNAVNNPTPGFVHQPSIMASGSSLAFAYQTNTSAESPLHMIGWRDSNGNGIFDVLDVPHHLEGIGTFDHGLELYRFQGLAEVGTLPNQNSSGLQNDITINRITRAEYRIDGGVWQTAAEYGTYTAELDLMIDVPKDNVLVEIRTITLDPQTEQFVASSPIFAAWSRETTATVQSGIQGFVWNDVDADGEWDANEIGLVGQTVQLVHVDGTVLPGPLRLDPDDHGNDTVLNQVQEGASLRAIGINVAGNSVVSRVHQNASTGTRVFAFLDPLGTGRTTWFREGSELHVEFATPQTHVQMDAIGAGGPSSGRLEAYDSAGNLLVRYNSAQLNQGQVETMTVAVGSPEIASIKAFGRALEPVLLDNLRWGPPTQVTVGTRGSYHFTGLSPGTYRVETQVSPGATVIVPETARYEVPLQNDSSASPLNFAVHPQWPWQNPIWRYDVNGDGLVNPFDVLVLVSELRAGIPSELPFPAPDRSPPSYFDVAGNGRLTPFDALLVVSHLRETSGNAMSTMMLTADGGAGQSEPNEFPWLPGPLTSFATSGAGERSWDTTRKSSPPLPVDNDQRSRDEFARPAKEFSGALRVPLTVSRQSRDWQQHWQQQVDAVFTDDWSVREAVILEQVCGLDQQFHVHEGGIRR